MEGECPSGTSGTPPACVIDKAELGDLTVNPGIRRVKRGGKAVFRVKVKNIGRQVARRVRICVTVPKNLVTLNKCRSIGEVRDGRTAARTFRVRVTRSSVQGEKIKLRFRVTSNVGAKHAHSTIVVK